MVSVTLALTEASEKGQPTWNALTCRLTVNSTPCGGFPEARVGHLPCANLRQYTTPRATKPDR